MNAIKQTCSSLQDMSSVESYDEAVYEGIGELY